MSRAMHTVAAKDPSGYRASGPSTDLSIRTAAEELADVGALGEDLGVGGLEGVLGVERPLPPGRLVLVLQV